MTTEATEKNTSPAKKDRPSSSTVVNGKYIYADDDKSGADTALQNLTNAGHEFRQYHLTWEDGKSYYVLEKNVQMGLGRLAMEQYGLGGEITGSSPRAAAQITPAKIIETIGQMTPEARKALLQQFAA
jgi:hypothetical protein